MITGLTVQVRLAIIKSLSLLHIFLGSFLLSVPVETGCCSKVWCWCSSPWCSSRGCSSMSAGSIFGNGASIIGVGMWTVLPTGATLMVVLVVQRYLLLQLGCYLLLPDWCSMS